MESNQDEDHTHPPNLIQVHRSSVDSSRPFTSVKEAVAIFGQRIHLPGHTQTLIPSPRSPSPSPAGFSRGGLSSSSSWKQSSLPCSPSNPREEGFMDVLKKLECELKETKTELMLLKEKESETEVALATLNAELHKNKSTMAKAEAEAAGKCAAEIVRTVSLETSEEERKEGREVSEEERRKELMKKMEREYYPTLAQILDGNKGDRQVCFGKTDIKKKTKKKPIVPLVGDFFFRKKRFSGEISAPLSSTLHFS